MFFFVVNDNQNTTEIHRKKLVPFLEQLFPQPSSFERK
ncbi:MAG: hypothetical protein J6Q47_01835 [Paludibacteraceae bacterium]|nr:hypothetical protein [Paludibacteraceae bacterium]